MSDLLWLLAVPLALAAHWAIDEDGARAWHLRRRCIREDQESGALAEREAEREAERRSTYDDVRGHCAHVSALRLGLEERRRSWHKSLENGYLATARSDKKAIAEIQRELDALAACAPSG